MGWTKRWLLMGLLVATAGCLDEGPQSGPGTVTGTLVGPNGPEGAALVTLLGPGVGTVSPVGTTQIFVRSVPGATELVLINPTGGELAFEVAVADTTAPPASVVVEVAGPNDELRSGLESYSVDFSR